MKNSLKIMLAILASSLIIAWGVGFMNPPTSAAKIPLSTGDVFIEDYESEVKILTETSEGIN